MITTPNPSFFFNGFHPAKKSSFLQCDGSGAFVTPGSGIGIGFSESRIPNPYVGKLWDHFLGKKYCNSLWIATHFFLYLFKNKIIFNFVIFVTTSKKNSGWQIFSPISFEPVAGSGIRDKHPESTTPDFCKVKRKSIFSPITFPQIPALEGGEPLPSPGTGSLTAKVSHWQRSRSSWLMIPVEIAFTLSSSSMLMIDLYKYLFKQRDFLDFFMYFIDQCCGSMTCWCGSGSGSGSADPCLD